MPSEDERLALVVDLARQVTARHDLDDVLATTFRCLRPMLQFTGGSIQLLDDDGWIRFAATDPAAPPHVLAVRIPLGSTVGGRVILTERPVYIPDILDDPAVPPERRSAVSRGVRSYLGVPLLADGHAIGLIQIDAEEPDAWSESDRLLLTTVAPIIAAAIQNARAYERQALVSERLRAVDECRRDLEDLIDSELEPAAAALQGLGDADDLPPVQREAVRLRSALTTARRLLALHREEEAAAPTPEGPGGEPPAGSETANAVPQQPSAGSGHGMTRG